METWTRISFVFSRKPFYSLASSRKTLSTYFIFRNYLTAIGLWYIFHHSQLSDSSKFVVGKFVLFPNQTSALSPNSVSERREVWGSCMFHLTEYSLWRWCNAWGGRDIRKSTQNGYYPCCLCRSTSRWWPTSQIRICYGHHSLPVDIRFVLGTPLNFHKNKLAQYHPTTSYFIQRWSTNNPRATVLCWIVKSRKRTPSDTHSALCNFVCSSILADISTSSTIKCRESSEPGRSVLR